MMIQVEDVTEQTISGSRYVYVTLSTDRHRVFVSFGPFEVRVVVMNSSHRAWRGMGKGFKDTAAAVANYKTGAIRALIEHAAQLAAMPAPTNPGHSVLTDVVA